MEYILWFSILGFIVGTIIGSFTLALAHRSLNKRSFLGRSYCPSCKHTLNWYDLFPLFSYLSVLGKCRYCHKKIGREYPLVEFTLGVIMAFLTWQSFQFFPGTSDYFKLAVFIFDLIFKAFFITVLAVVFITDLKKMFIPDRVILPSIVISIVALVGISLYKVIYLYYYLLNHSVGKYLLPPHSDYFQRHALDAAFPLWGGLISGLGIGGFFLLLIIVTRGKGMGGGDVKLGAFMGICLGFPNSILAVVLSFLIGSIYAIFLLLTKKKHFGQAIAFGPFLVIGSLIALFWGSQIIDWYLSLQL